jgi:hypothetical protein
MIKGTRQSGQKDGYKTSVKDIHDSLRNVSKIKWTSGLTMGETHFRLYQCVVEPLILSAHNFTFF